MLEELYMERDICTVIFRWPASEGPTGAPDETGLETCIRIKCRYSTDVHVTHIDDICQRTFHIVADISRSVSIHEVLSIQCTVENIGRILPLKLGVT